MKKLTLLFAVFFAMSGFVNTAKAIGISIDLNDRPYYTYGDRYWARELIGAGFRGIGAGVTIITFGSTGTTGPADGSKPAIARSK